LFRFHSLLAGAIMRRMTPPFVYTEAETAAVLRVAPEAVRAWLRRGDLRPIALTSDGRSLFALRDVEAIGRRLASVEKVRALRPGR
jgi:predicted site-specific integrase-resolvase